MQSVRDVLLSTPPVTTTAVVDNRVCYRDAAGTEHSIQADSVVICGGSSPQIAEAMAYANSANEFYAIGDCNGAGNLWKSNRDAWSKANLI